MIIQLVVVIKESTMCFLSLTSEQFTSSSNCVFCHSLNLAINILINSSMSTVNMKDKESGLDQLLNDKELVKKDGNFRPENDDGLGKS